MKKQRLHRSKYIKNIQIRWSFVEILWIAHNPLKLIVSCINSPYSFAIYIKDITKIDNSIRKSFRYIKDYVKDSFELVNYLNGLSLDPNYKLVSFNVYEYTYVLSNKKFEKTDFHKQQN